MPIVHVHNFSYGLLNPVLGYLMSCIVIMLAPSEEEMLADARLAERLAERPVSHHR